MIRDVLTKALRKLRRTNDRAVGTCSAAREDIGIPVDSSRPDCASSQQMITRMAEEVACFGRWSLDATSNRFAWSDGLARLHGRAMPKGGWLDFDAHLALLHPEDSADLRGFLIRVIDGMIVASDGYFSRRFRLVRPDGDVRHVALHGRRTCDRNGRTLSLDGIALDISDLVRSEQRLQETSVLLRSTIDNMDQGIIASDGKRRVRLFNRRVIELLGLPDDLLFEGASLADFSAAMEARGDFAEQPNRLRAFLDDPGSVPPCYERGTLDGGTLEIRRKSQPDGGCVTTFTDASLRKRAERELAESERRFRLLAENTNDVIILSDTSFGRIYVSPAVRRVLGYEPTEFAAMRVADSVHPDDRAGFELIREDIGAAPQENFVTSARYRHKRGHWIWCEVSVRLVRDQANDSPMHYVLALRDISLRREAESKIRHLALHDPLTGLPNRALLRDRLAAAVGRTVRSGKPCAVLACDLDRFKTVNDTLGHPAGDALLGVVTTRMSRVLRESDMLARLGGDEFAIVIEDIDDHLDVSAIANLLIEAVGAPMNIDGHRVEVGASIGIALAVGDIDCDELFKQADIALYQAKAAGRNTSRLYEPGAIMAAAARGQLALDMREALRNGGFRLVYQPIVDIATNRARSFEALLRWDHPHRGAISPAEFIPVAEDSGMIVQLGAWALREACRTAALMPPDIRVAVNVSPVQFLRPSFEETVISALAHERLSPQRLKLEVTESVLLEDSESVLACLHRLRGLGIRVALDDFGTGYSSLRYLRRFPFDAIKVDGSFVRDIADPDTAAIIRAIVSIGERLGIGVTAEGVETRDQLERLVQEGCAAVQGFLFSRPLETADAIAYARAAKTLAA